MAYVSFPPMTVETSRDSAYIQNPDTEAEVTASLFRGGLDPVAIAAAAGDTLDIWIFDDDIVTERFLVEVPARRPPKVVRSVPTRGEVSVPLNAKIVIILSEPADPSTVSPASVQLRRGGAVVAAEITAENGGIFVQIAPAQPLERFTEYEVRISDQIRDLSGDRLDAGFSFRFTTGSPAAGKIAYHRIEFGSPYEQKGTAIFIVNADGTDIQRVSPPITVGDSRPEWSPDGTRIAFQRQEGDWSNIWVMDANGDNAVQLTDSRKWSSDPRWSADGSQIVYWSCTSSSCAIMLMNADGTDPRNLATGWDPDISPDGTKILFSYYEPGWEGPYCRVEELYNCAIYVVNADGTDLTQIASELGGYPRWSPDGSRIAFVKNERLGSEGEVDYSTLYVMNADGTNATPVITDRIVYPDWSPDGSQIVYESREPYPSWRGAIVTVYVDGSGWTTVVPHDYPNWNGHPSWAP